MEDLIKEEEFISKAYNPWPYFKVFYLIIPIFGIINLLFKVLPLDEGFTLLVTSLNTLLPIITGCIMVFSRKRNILLPLTIIIKALFYLMCIVCVSYQVLNIFEALNYGLEPLFYVKRVPYGFVFPIIHLMFCLVIILPIRALIKKFSA